MRAADKIRDLKKEIIQSRSNQVLSSDEFPLILPEVLLKSAGLRMEELRIDAKHLAIQHYRKALGQFTLPIALHFCPSTVQLEKFCSKPLTMLYTEQSTQAAIE